MPIYDENATFGWDDTVSVDSEFTLLPPGDYDFTVVNLERARHSGSEKLPPCDKAIVTCEVTDGMQKTKVTVNFFFVRKSEWKITEFLRSIGLKKPGEEINIAQGFKNSIGRSGRCKVSINKYTTKSGNGGQNNQIDKFYDYVPPVGGMSGFQPAQSMQNQIPAQFQQTPVQPAPAPAPAPQQMSFSQPVGQYAQPAYSWKAQG